METNDSLLRSSKMSEQIKKIRNIALELEAFVDNMEPELDEGLRFQRNNFAYAARREVKKLLEFIELQHSRRMELKKKSESKQAMLKVKKLCKQYRIEFSLDEDTSVIWAYLPKEIISKFHNGEDPWEDGHYFYSPEELLDCIEALS